MGARISGLHRQQPASTVEVLFRPSEPQCSSTRSTDHRREPIRVLLRHHQDRFKEPEVRARSHSLTKGEPLWNAILEIGVRVDPFHLRKLSASLSRTLSELPPVGTMLQYS